jgi:phage terminase Nu1 subunit (DNA packaging protein)
MPDTELTADALAEWLGISAVAVRDLSRRGIVVKVSRNAFGTLRAGMLAIPSRAAQRLPHLTAHDVAEIDSEVRGVRAELAEPRQ